MGFNAAAIDRLIALGKPLQVGIKGSPQPFGPGVVEPAFPEPIDSQTPDYAATRGYYRIIVQSTFQADKNARPTMVNVPIIFHVDDVLIVLQEPQPIEQPLVVAPAPGRGGGGLHIPGGS